MEMEMEMETVIEMGMGMGILLQPQLFEVLQWSLKRR